MRSFAATYEECVTGSCVEILQAGQACTHSCTHTRCGMAYLMCPFNVTNFSEIAARTMGANTNITICQQQQQQQQQQ